MPLKHSSFLRVTVGRDKCNNILVNPYTHYNKGHRFYDSLSDGFIKQAYSFFDH